MAEPDVPVEDNYTSELVDPKKVVRTVEYQGWDDGTNEKLQLKQHATIT